MAYDDAYGRGESDNPSDGIIGFLLNRHADQQRREREALADPMYQALLASELDSEAGRGGPRGFHLDRDRLLAPVDDEQARYEGLPAASRALIDELFELVDFERFDNGPSAEKVAATQRAREILASGTEGVHANVRELAYGSTLLGLATMHSLQMVQALLEW